MAHNFLCEPHKTKKCICSHTSQRVSYLCYCIILNFYETLNKIRVEASVHMWKLETGSAHGKHKGRTEGFWVTATLGLQYKRALSCPRSLISVAVHLPKIPYIKVTCLASASKIICFTKDVTKLGNYKSTNSVTFVNSITFYYIIFIFMEKIIFQTIPDILHPIYYGNIMPFIFYAINRD